jgi:hypothetical protein
MIIPGYSNEFQKRPYARNRGILILKLKDSEGDMAPILADAWAGHP